MSSDPTKEHLQQIVRVMGRQRAEAGSDCNLTLLTQMCLVLGAITDDSSRRAEPRAPASASSNACVSLSTQ